MNHSQQSLSATDSKTIDPGLEGIVVGVTAISAVNGAAGELRYRDVPIEELVDRPFAEVAALVLLGRPDPSASDALQAVQRYIDSAGALNAAERARVLALPRTLHPMHMLQSLIPTLTPDPRLGSLDAGLLSGINRTRPVPPGLTRELAQGLCVAGKLPMLIALHRRGQDLSQAGTGYAERFLQAIEAPTDPALVRAFEVMQILQLEHSFNASAFAARVIASTQAPIENALAGAVGALHGRLHGGADQAALETADAVGDPRHASAFVDDCLNRGQKIMGMGHREYRVLDPRARFARALAEQLTRGTEHERTLATLTAIEARFRERMADRGRELHANIEFYKGLIFRSLGLAPNTFTALFASARVFGYVAHVLESRFDDRLIRPAARSRSQ